MYRIYLNDTVGHLDLWECDPGQIAALGRKYAPALPAAFSACRAIKCCLGTLEALRGIAAMLGQRFVTVPIKTLMSWQGLDATQTNRRKIRWDLSRLAKCGVLDRGLRDSSRGRTLAVAVLLQPDLFLESQCPPLSANGHCEMAPVPRSEPDLPQSVEGGDKSPPISNSEVLAYEDTSEFNDPYPDAPDSVCPLPTLQKEKVVVVGQKPVGNLGKALRSLRLSNYAPVDNHGKTGKRMTGEEYDAFVERQRLPQDDEPDDDPIFD